MHANDANIINNFLNNHISASEKIRFFFSRNWLKMSKFLSFREKMVVFLLVFLICGSLIFWLAQIYFGATKPIPKTGGEYVEGIVGQPLYINSLLSQTSESDADLVQLIYSGLLKYDSEGKLKNEMAESYEISDDQKIYTVHLKKSLFWHDGQPLTAGDILFTISILQDPAYKSPLRQNWQGVEVSQIDDYTLNFALSSPYSGFLNNLTLGILPKHIWGNIAPEKFSLADYNLKPIGSGPYQFVNFQKSSTGEILFYELKAFNKYSEGEPYITKLNINFYPDNDMMLTAFNKKEIKGMENIDPEKIEGIKNKKSTLIKELSFPRYFSVFFNQTKSVPLANIYVRQALSQAVNRQEIINAVLGGKGAPIYSPFLPTMKEFNNDIDKREFNLDRARQILDDAGWKLEEGETVRKKNGTQLEFKLQTADWPDLVETADVLVKQWNEIGVKADVETLSVTDLQQNYIRPREYEALLFGQVTNFNPDLYPFWHSSQKQDPGFNLALFDDKDADIFLRDIRQESDENKRIEKYKELQRIIADKAPAAFLYSPYYLFPISNKIKGVEIKNINSPSWRFADVNKWYVKTARVKK
ncbi:MAG: ABC transporter substrate-binding protein [Patescibacteria group bacterium]